MIDFLRHSAWISPLDLEPLTIVGCGAVGSNIAEMSARMGFSKFILFDDDQVESHNLPNQAYNISHLNDNKASALSKVISSINPLAEVIVNERRFDSSVDELSGAVVMAVDSIAARRDIAKAVKQSFPDVDITVEVRLGFDYGQISVLDPSKDQLWKSWDAALGNDADIPEGPCNRKICTTLVHLTSAIAVHNLCNFYNAKRENKDWEYDPFLHVNMTSSLDILKTN